VCSRACACAALLSAVLHYAVPAAADVLQEQWLVQHVLSRKARTAQKQVCGPCLTAFELEQMASMKTPGL
jgi:hypothetical protein